MKLQQWSLIAVGVGMFLVALGWLWPVLVPRQALWDEQRAASFAAASVELHEAIHADEHGHDHGGAFHRHSHGDHAHSHDQEIQEAQARYAAARAQLEQAHKLQDSVPRYLQWAGVLVGGIGAVGFFFGQRE